MSGRDITVGFTDYYNPIDEFFVSLLSKRYNVIRDDVNPNYLFFCDETFGTNNLKYDPNKVLKIFFTGENRRPWNYNAHAAISFDHLDGPSNYRLPLYVVEDWYQTKKLKMKSILDLTRNEKKVTNPLRFCSFIASNGASVERNEAFYLLSQYKRVDSAGPLFNNVGYVLPRGSNAQVHKLNFMEEAKFNLCYENSSYPGYVTEKLFHALYAGVVPIYWGSPTVELDFNPDAFISRHDYDTFEKMLDKIREIYHNDEMYQDMTHQPIFSKRGKEAMNTDRFLDWFDRHIYLGNDG
jgi:alpha(1,3/1,4) fucosyltransferase